MTENNNKNEATIIILGDCQGKYVNQNVEKEFEGKLLMTARADGAVLVHNLNDGVRPIVYFNGGADISIANNTIDCEVEAFVTSEDGQQLTLQFTHLIFMHGTPGKMKEPSMARNILKCVFDMGGTYGRTTIARVLTGSVSKKVLTINLSKLSTYGVLKDSSMKQTLSLTDWLIEEGYIAYADDSEFPVLVITTKGIDILSGGDELPVEITDESLDVVERNKAILKEWRDRKTSEKSHSEASTKDFLDGKTGRPVENKDG